MSQFDDREKAFENKFAHDAMVDFKVAVRRNKLVGLWAAEKLGKTGADAVAYATDVVMADLDGNPDNDLIAKLLKDFGRAGLTVHISEIEHQMTEWLPIARKQIMEGL